jgi:hypothetical protein
MINSASELMAALRKGKFAGVMLWQGASAIDGAPIAAIATRLVAKSKNSKTGEMIQTFIIRSDVHPIDALRSGADASVCGECLHRPIKGGACYVQVGKSVASVYGALQRGRYAVPGKDFAVAILPELFAGRVVRLGAYGDPAAVPFQVWRAVTLRAAACNGYTHQWRNPKFGAFKLLTMASCDTVLDYAEAKAAGWRTFRVRLSTEGKGDREVVCPASNEAGYKTDCASCRACGGLSAKAKVDMVIVAHGPTAKRFAVTQAALLAA